MIYISGILLGLSSIVSSPWLLLVGSVIQESAYKSESEKEVGLLLHLAPVHKDDSNQVDAVQVKPTQKKYIKIGMFLATLLILYSLQYLIWSNVIIQTDLLLNLEVSLLF